MGWFSKFQLDPISLVYDLLYSAILNLSKFIAKKVHDYHILPSGDSDRKRCKLEYKATIAKHEIAQKTQKEVVLMTTIAQVKSKIEFHRKMSKEKFLGLKR